MKVYSKGRSEIIEQAGRKSFHMWFDLDIEPRWVSMEADLSLPTKSNRKISMMTSFNEELYNAAWEFLWKVKLYDSDMQEFTDDMLVTVVTRMIHKAIEKLNEKDEPLWNIYIKTPKAKSRELELAKEEYLGKKTKIEKKDIDEEELINTVTEIKWEVQTAESKEEVTKTIWEVKVETKSSDIKEIKWDAKRVKSFKDLDKIKKPVKEKKENPFYDSNKVF